MLKLNVNLTRGVIACFDILLTTSWLLSMFRYRLNEYQQRFGSKHAGHPAVPGSAMDDQDFAASFHGRRPHHYPVIWTSLQYRRADRLCGHPLRYCCSQQVLLQQSSRICVFSYVPDFYWFYRCRRNELIWLDSWWFGLWLTNKFVIIFIFSGFLCLLRINSPNKLYEQVYDCAYKLRL